MLQRGCGRRIIRIFAVFVAAASLLALARPRAGVARSEARADCPWVGSSAPLTQRVDQVLGRMTLEEKLALLHGVGRAAPYAGRVPAIERLCVPPLVLHDGPNGVAGSLPQVTQLPAPVAAAATWDTALMRAYGGVIGAEQKAKGVSVVLAPMVNIVRDPRFGRAFETFGEDPYLAGRLAVASVQGIQGRGVLAQVKHLAVYNQETHRFDREDDAVVDERTLQEIYLPAFDAAIHEAGAASVMCSYNHLNGTSACESRELLTEVLRRQWGFEGFVTSDWGGTRSVAAADGGLDQEMPAGKYFGEALKSAVQSGRVSVARLDEMVRHVLTPMFRFGLFERPITGEPSAPAANAASEAVARQVAEQGAVLLKNGMLPIDPARLRSIAVIGQPAHDEVLTTDGLGNPVATPTGVITPYEAIRQRAGGGVRVTYTPGPSFEGKLPVVPDSVLTPEGGTGSGLTARYYTGAHPTGTPALQRVDPVVDFAWQGAPPAPGLPSTHWSATWSGTITPPKAGSYTFSLRSDDGSRLYIGGTPVVDDWGRRESRPATGTIHLVAGSPVPIKVEYFQDGGDAGLSLGWLPPDTSPVEEAVTAATAADAAVVFVASRSWEGFDLPDIDLPSGQNDLVSAVAKANRNTVVVVQSGSAVTMPWIDSASAVLEVWFPGQAIGPALAVLLFGDVSPSGKLPVTFPKTLADVPAHTAARWPGATGEVRYDEGLKVGYRWYNASGIEPLFPFGHGLSYTSFAFDGLSISRHPPDGGVTVTARVRNTGRRAGAEVAQLYLGFPASAGEPPRQLKGFKKVALEPGLAEQVTFTLDDRAFSAWNTATHSWAKVPGVYEVAVGSSSRQLPLLGRVRID